MANIPGKQASLKFNSRREILRRMTYMAAASGLPFATAQSAQGLSAQQLDAGAQRAPWLEVELTAPDVPGYGTDPNLIKPLAEPWPRTLSDEYLAVLGDLADIIFPLEGDNPAASELGVPGVIDHWISAPYPVQQEHRHMIVAGLSWVDRESQRRFGVGYHAATAQQQIQIVDELAFPPGQESRSGLATGVDDIEVPVVFFNLLRRLAAGAYYSSDHGVKELGYQGNVPLVGDYPGPDDAAMEHLQEQLQVLGLTL